MDNYNDSEDCLTGTEEINIEQPHAHLLILVNNNNNNKTTNTNVQTDICSQQEIWSKLCAGLTLSQADKMEVDLFHLLKASNDPLVF